MTGFENVGYRETYKYRGLRREEVYFVRFKNTNRKTDCTEIKEGKSLVGVVHLTAKVCLFVFLDNELCEWSSRSTNRRPTVSWESTPYPIPTTRVSQRHSSSTFDKRGYFGPCVSRDPFIKSMIEPCGLPYQSRLLLSTEDLPLTEDVTTSLTFSGRTT